MIKNFAVIVFVVCLSQSSWAAPPVDLSRFENDKPLDNKPKELIEKDLVYADPVADKEEKPAINVRKIIVDTVARKGARENSAAIFKLKVGEVVRVTKISRDKKWCIVQVIATGRRAWIPISALSGPITSTKKETQ